MCVNFVPATTEQLVRVFGAWQPTFEFKPEAYPGYRMPMLRKAPQGTLTPNGIECLPASFGLIPHWAKDSSISRHTYNARSETVAEKPSYRLAWRKAQFALVPMQAFFEPNYESGKAVRWRIELADQNPFAVAALWDVWKNPETQREEASFSLLTVNADEHGLLKRFHKPGDEKRSIVIIPADHYDGWLNATAKDTGAFLKLLHPDELTAQAAPPPSKSAQI